MHCYTCRKRFIKVSIIFLAVFFSLHASQSESRLMAVFYPKTVRVVWSYGLGRGSVKAIEPIAWQHWVVGMTLGRAGPKIGVPTPSKTPNLRLRSIINSADSWQMEWYFLRVRTLQEPARIARLRFSLDHRVREGTNQGRHIVSSRGRGKQFLSNNFSPKSGKN